jgi:hypothetical protein
MITYSEPSGDKELENASKEGSQSLTLASGDKVIWSHQNCDITGAVAKFPSSEG